jgi:2-alkyl-3-oxoalkanoate reductase
MNGEPGLPSALIKGQRVLVTGGGGFLGRAIVRRLLDRGITVRSFSRGAYPELDRLGVETLRGDLADPGAVRSACDGCDLVFHVAALPGVWGDYADFYNTNFLGTVNVVAACRDARVGRLVYTSSPSVVFDGGDMEGADESVPYPRRFKAAYPETKSMAERYVLRANGDDLLTLALRPHLIWGPGDNHLIPRIVARARAGRLRIVGDNTNRVDAVYIDNAADAHLCAAERLSPGSPCAGKAYFIAQDEPLPLWDIVNRILAAAGQPPLTRRVSARAAYAVGAIMEVLYSVLPLKGEPMMTRFVARELATSHWFDLSAAKRDLGYQPAISMDEGFARLAASFAEMEAALS